MKRQRTHYMWAISATAALSLGACKDKTPTQPLAAPAKKAEPIAIGAAIFLDATKTADLDRTKAEAWPRLDSLLPENSRRYGTWEQITGVASAGPFTIKKPGATYGALIPALYPDPSGAGIAFGLFDPVDLARKGTPKVQHAGLTELRVHIEKSGARGANEHMGGETTDPNKLTLTIIAGAASTTLSGVQLLALPRENAPDDDSGEHQGWKLSAVLDNANIRGAKRILLTGDEMNLTLEPADLDPQTSVPFIKLNRQGTLRFRTYKKEGAGWIIGGDLRGLRSIQILQ
jgi:hypothetical protein